MGKLYIFGNGSIAYTQDSNTVPSLGGEQAVKIVDDTQESLSPYLSEDQMKKVKNVTNVIQSNQR